MKFNLILASKGDKVAFLDLLFASLSKQKGENELKIYFVDQNRDSRNEAIIKKWNGHLNIVFICDLGIGLSRARNVGLDALYYDNVSGDELVLFPDDDCVFCEDFFSKITCHFCDPSIYGVYYRVFDVADPNLELAYTSKLNSACLDFKSLFASITSINFIHRVAIDARFDEDFGLGGKFKSSEEILYIAHFLKNGFSFKYLKEVKILHPNLDTTVSTNELYHKVWHNSVGHGALAGKLGRLGAFKASVYILLISPIGRIIVSTLLLDIKGARIGLIYLVRRWYGLWGLLNN
jgi:hypothetical protein